MFIWGGVGMGLGVIIILVLTWLVPSPEYVPEYPTVLRPCAEGQDFTPVPIVIDGESTILPCNDPVTVYPKADR
jgi:hypothetical protein